MRRTTRMTMHPTSEAVRDRPGLRARLLPNPFPHTVSLGPPSGDGRSKDYMRQALSQDLCRSALLQGRTPSAGIVPADRGKCPASGGFRATEPLSDPALYGGESKLPSPGAVERRRRTENTHATPSTLPPSQKVWEKRRSAAPCVTPLRNSPGPSVTYLSLRHPAPRFLRHSGPRAGIYPLPPSHSDAPRGISALPDHPATRHAIPSSRRGRSRACPPHSVVPAEAGTSTHSPTSRPYHLHRTHNAPLLPIRHSRVVGNPSPVRGQGCPTPRSTPNP